MSLTFGLLGISLVLVALYLSFNSLAKAKKYISKSSQMEKLEDRYDQLRSTYSELKVKKYINHTLHIN